MSIATTPPNPEQIEAKILELLGGRKALQGAKVIHRGVVAEGEDEAAALLGAFVRRDSKLRCAARVLRVRTRRIGRRRVARPARCRRDREKLAGKRRHMVGTGTTATDPPGDEPTPGVPVEPAVAMALGGVA